MKDQESFIIEEQVRRAIDNLRKIGYLDVSISASDFYTWMNADKFAPDKITMYDVLSSESLMVHEAVEINEIKKQGIKITNKVLLDSPKEAIYQAHLKALGVELDFILITFKNRLRDLEQVYRDDPYAPLIIQEKAKIMHSEYSKIVHR